MASEAVRPSLQVGAVLAAAAMLGLLAGVAPKFALLAAIGLLFVVLVLNNVALGLGLLAFTAFLDVLPTFGSLSIAKAVGVMLVISWLAAIAGRPGMRSLVRERPALTWGIVLFLAWAAASVLWAEDRGATFTSLQRYAPNLLVFPIAYTAVRTEDDAWRVLSVIVGGAAFAAMAGIVVPPVDATQFGPGRAAGLTGDANELAASLVAGLALAAAFTFNRAFSSGARLLAAGTAGLCLLGIFLSLSRGGLVALAAMLVVGVLLSGRYRARASVLAVIAGGAALLYFASVASEAATNRVLQLGGGSGRVDLWTIATRMFEAHPIRGVGAGNFPNASIHYLLQPGVIQRDDFVINAEPFVTHNTYLQILAEGGVIALALFLLVVLLALWSMVSAARGFARAGEVKLEVLARGLAVGTIGYLVAIVFISQMYAKLLWILLALGPPLLALAREREKRTALSAAAAP